MRKYPNITWSTHLLLKAIKVRHTLSGLNNKLENHPEFPSIMAVMDCLDSWQVPNEAIMLSKQDLSGIKTPFIAHLLQGNGSLILVESVSENNIIFSDEKYVKAQLDHREFLSKWSGIILHAEVQVDSGEPDYFENRSLEWFEKIKLPVLIFILFCGILMKVTEHGLNLSVAFYLYLIISLAGVLVTSLLLVNSIDSDNAIVQNLCGIAKKNGCNSLLKSPASKITKWLSWSELGFFYFSGCALSLIFAPASLYFVITFSFVALPYPFYSIAYQYLRRDWCVLCCAVQLLLLSGYITLVGFDLWPAYPTYFSSLNFYTLASSFLLPIISWYILKPFFSKSQRIRPLTQQLKKFKHNGELFNGLLKNQPSYPVNDDLMPLVIGNPDAVTVITIVSNPFCRPCSEAHKFLVDLIRLRDDLQLNIIFANSGQSGDEGLKVSRHLQAINTLEDSLLMENALEDWYNQKIKNFKDWMPRHPVVLREDIKKSVYEIDQKQRAWCEAAGVLFTPTIFVNGFKLPEPYTLKDIPYVLN